MKRFIVSCRFSFVVYAKNTREETTKCSLNTTQVISDAYVHALAKFVIFQGTAAPDCFKNHANC